MRVTSLVFALLATPASAAFVSPVGTTPGSATRVSPLQYRQTADTDDAVRAAQKAIGTPSKTSIDIPNLKDLQNLSDLQKEALAATAGGALLGAGIAVMGQPDFAVDPIIPATIVGSAAYVVGSKDDEIGRTTRTFLGKPTQALGRFIASKFKKMVNSAVASIAAIPERVADAFNRYVEKTKAEIYAIPGNVMALIKQKMEETQQEISSLPQKMMDEATIQAEHLAQEIKETPGRMADNAKKAFEEATLETKQMLNMAVEKKKPTTPVKEELVPKPSLKKLIPKPPQSNPPLTIFMNY